MATLDDLLKYKEKVVLKHPKTGKDLKAVWVRVLGDEDLKESFRFARIASADKRKALRDKSSGAYRDEIESILKESSREDQITLILASKENEFANTAPIIVPREDLPKIEEIAVQPDAPTLEEQERIDTAEEEQTKRFQEAIEDYIKTKLNEVKASLEDMSDETVFDLAAIEYINVQALGAFLEELNDQKAFRGTYSDEACTEKGFSSLESFKNADGNIKAQLIKAYNELEISGDELKN